MLVLADLGGAFSGKGKQAVAPAAGPSTAAKAPAGSTTAAAPTSKAPSTGTRPATSSTPPPTVASTPVHKVTVAEATWTLPNTLSRMVVLAIPGGLEMMGGLLDGDTSSALVRLVALPSGKAALDARLSVGVHAAAGASYQGHLFVYGGTGNGTVATVQRIARGHVAVAAGALPAPRAGMVEAQAGGKVVLLGGYDGTNALADVLVSSNGTTFTVLTRLPVPVRYPAVAVRGNDVYLYGGDVAGKPSDVIQKVDVAAGTATLAGHLPQPLSHEAALVFGSTVWLAGGTSTSGTSAALFRSDDAVTFVRDGVLPEARTDAGVAMVGGVGYLLGGENGSRLKSVVLIKPG